MALSESDKIIIFNTITKIFSKNHGACFNMIEESGREKFTTCIKLITEGSCLKTPDEKCDFKLDSLEKLRKLLIKASSDEEKSIIITKIFCYTSVDCDFCFLKRRLCRSWDTLTEKDKEDISDIVNEIFSPEFGTF